MRPAGEPPAPLHHEGEDWLHFQVRDTGIGISPDKQGRIFDIFTQEDSSTTRKYGGAGLGLSIGQRLYRMAGGEITVASEPGNGSARRQACMFIDPSRNDS